MQRTHWNRRRVIAWATGLLLAYVVLSASNNTYEKDVTIRKTNPEEVWEFVADFSKMRLLNPTM